jgi:hypothetical protein
MKLSKIKFVAASLVAASLATTILSVGAVSAQSAPSPDGAYRGMLVCTQQPGQAAVMRVPLDLVISNNAVQFARPIFVNGRAVGSEMGSGTLEGTTLHVKTSGNNDSAHYEVNYSGELALDGGTLMGTQVRAVPTEARGRSCIGAFIKVRP